MVTLISNNSKGSMKKILLFFLLFGINPLHPMDGDSLKLKLPLYSEKESLLNKKKKKTEWHKPCLLALLALSTTGLVADISTRVKADALNDQVGPITAYPFVYGQGFPFFNGDGPAQKINCTYTLYEEGYWKPRGLPCVKGSCGCIRGRECRCTIEKCPPAQEYETHFNNQLGCNITSICTRVITLLGIGGWLANQWNQ